MKIFTRTLCMTFIFLLTGYSLAVAERMTLKQVSEKANISLPEIYDPVTKLLSTSVENNNFVYHFIVDADQKEFDKALPHVKKRIETTVCRDHRDKTILKNYKANLVYRYENAKGQSLGQFMIRPDHCR